MKGTERHMGVGVQGLQPEGLFQRCANALPQAFGQRLRDADALAVAPQGVGLPVPCGGIERFNRGLHPRALRRLQKQVEPAFLRGLKVVGVNAARLVGYGDTCGAQIQAGLQGALKKTVVEMRPRLKHRIVTRHRLRVARMQPLPVLRDATRVIDIGADEWKGGPRQHDATADAVQESLES